MATRTFEDYAPDGTLQTVETFFSRRGPANPTIGVRRAIDGWQPVFNPSYLGGYRTIATAVDTD